MLQTLKKSILVSMAWISLSMPVLAAEELRILLWKIPESEGKTPTFYQEDSHSSKTVGTFKPHQTVQVLAQQKEWAKVGQLNNSGQTAWVPAEVVKSLTQLTVILNQDSNGYQCQVRICDPEGRETGNWRMAHRMFESSDKTDKNGRHKGLKRWVFGKKNAPKEAENWEKEFDELEEAFLKQEEIFFKQQAALMNIMRSFFTELNQSTEEDKAAVEAKAKPSEVKIEEKQSLVIKEEKVS